MRAWVIILVLLPVLLPLAGCTSSEDMALLHREITDVQRQVEHLRAEGLGRGDFATLSQRLESEAQRMVRSSADLGQRLDRLEEQMEALRASLELTTRQLSTIAQELAAARANAAYPALPPVRVAPPAEGPGAAVGSEPVPAPGGGPAGPAAGAVLDPEQLYRSAYEDYLRGNYDLALDGFQEYLRRFPTSDLADNAQYWIGECYDAQGRSQEALGAFSKVLEQYPSSDKAAAAQLKVGLINLRLGDEGQGVVHLQYVVYEHPGTREAELAREKLRTLGITIR